MRYQTLLGVLVAVVTSLGAHTMGAHRVAAAGDDELLGRPECVQLAQRKKSLEAAGIRDTLAQRPAEVVAQHGRAAVERVQQYIALSEKVLFRCPLHVLNATAAPLEERMQYLPPLPGKGPRRARVIAPRGTIIPLPVQRRS